MQRQTRSKTVGLVSEYWPLTLASLDQGLSVAHTAFPLGRVASQGHPAIPRRQGLNYDLIGASVPRVPRGGREPIVVPVPQLDEPLFRLRVTEARRGAASPPGPVDQIVHVLPRYRRISADTFLIRQSGAAPPGSRNAYATNVKAITAPSLVALLSPPAPACSQGSMPHGAFLTSAADTYVFGRGRKEAHVAGFVIPTSR
jgi:hypothetical protein